MSSTYFVIFLVDRKTKIITLAVLSWKVAHCTRGAWNVALRAPCSFSLGNKMSRAMRKSVRSTLQDLQVASGILLPNENEKNVL